MLTNAELRELKGRSQKLKATFKVGKEGLSPAFVAALAHAFDGTELIKVKFADFKDQKKELAPQIAEKTGSRIILQVGNVVTLYRCKPAADEESA
jgi:RNA-binding protein